MPSLLDLLKKFPSCHPPLEALLDALPALAPRLYSVASSPFAQPHKVSAAFVLTVNTFGLKSLALNPLALGSLASDP
jgi:sulfite reductase alpha subunit-like flavoprotein